jgi:hypothetical protein
MWILPKQLHTSAFVPDTAALISDSAEQSEICAQSLLARSKPSPARTWSQRWKRDSWTQHLSGRILKPSHGPSFVTAWTSCLAATRANPLAQPASDSAPKTHDTSGRTYQPELLQCDQVPAFLKTSTDISRWGFPTCCKTWSDWVTERRGAWRQRVNAARLTRGSGSLSWPTISVNESKNSVGKSQLDRNSIPLGTSVLDGGVCLLRQNATAGMTMNPEMSARSADSTIATIANAPDQLKTATNTPNLMEFYTQGQSLHGQAAPASSSSLGSRQGLWLTPRANEPTGDSTFVTRNGDRGQHCSPSLTIQVEKAKQWMTPRACEAQNPPMGVDKRHHGLTHQVTKQWATPATQDTQGKRGAAANARKGNPLDTLPNQMAQWGTPTARDHKSGRGNEVREYKELTPMVERQQTGKLNSQWVTQLMGLPMGWVSPSCPASVIKNWPRFVTGWLQATTAPTSCDSSETESCRPAQSERSNFFLAS